MFVVSVVVLKESPDFFDRCVEYAFIFYVYQDLSHDIMPYVMDLTPSHYDNGDYCNFESLIGSRRRAYDVECWKQCSRK